MTANELRQLFNNKFGVGEWPATYVVDHETYANACQEVFNNRFSQEELTWGMLSDGMKSNVRVIPLFLGMSRGIMFKNVELILGEPR